MFNKFQKSIFALITFAILIFTTQNLFANDKICTENAKANDMLQWIDPCGYCKVVGCNNTICSNTFCCGKH